MVELLQLFCMISLAHAREREMQIRYLVTAQPTQISFPFDIKSRKWDQNQTNHIIWHVPNIYTSTENNYCFIIIIKYRILAYKF